MKRRYELRELTSDEIKEVKALRYNAPNATLKQRSQIIFMINKNRNNTNTEISKNLEVSNENITNVIKGFNEEGLKYLTDSKNKGNPSELDKYKELIKKDFSEKPPKNSEEARIRIKELTGIDKHVNTIREWLKKTDVYIKSLKPSQPKQLRKNNKNLWMWS